MSGLRQALAEWYGEELLFCDPDTVFDECIVGVVSRCGFEPVVCYDQGKVIAQLAREGMSLEEAEEFFWFNTHGAYVGERTPMFLVTAGELRPET